MLTAESAQGAEKLREGKLCKITLCLDRVSPKSTKSLYLNSISAIFAPFAVKKTS